ncbi:hypothetical protein PF011_g28678, partial [Phytophthora fragariae]
EELCGRFLNFELGMSVHAPAKRRTGDITSLWTDIRNNLKLHGLKLETAPADPESGAPAKTLQLRVPHHAEWLDHRNVLRHESDYRFALAGRLNQVDTLSVLQRRHLRSHDRCRHPGCSYPETLAHVLNHCLGTMDAVRGRHDDALKEIERTLTASSGDRSGRVELRVNQTVPSLAGPALRPDLQLYNHTTKTVAVVDLAVGFEEQASDDPESSGLAKAAAEKKAKYAGIKCHLERQGWKVHLSALVYGSLGAVSPTTTRSTRSTWGSSSAMRSGRRIWNLHCAQHRARQHERPRGSRATETGGTPSRTGRH